MLDFRTLAINAAQGSSWIAEDIRADGQRLVDIQQYTYNVAILDLAAGATGEFSLNIFNDSDFITDALGAACHFTNGQRSPLYGIVQVTDLGTGRTLFDKPAHMAATFGTLGVPLILPVPKTFVRDSKVLIQVTNVATDARDFHINLMGSRIYYA
jgi:hypothetical protein